MPAAGGLLDGRPLAGTGLVGRIGIVFVQGAQDVRVPVASGEDRHGPASGVTRLRFGSLGEQGVHLGSVASSHRGDQGGIQRWVGARGGERHCRGRRRGECRHRAGSCAGMTPHVFDDRGAAGSMASSAAEDRCPPGWASGFAPRARRMLTESGWSPLTAASKGVHERPSVGSAGTPRFNRSVNTSACP